MQGKSRKWFSVNMHVCTGAIQLINKRFNDTNYYQSKASQTFPAKEI